MRDDVDRFRWRRSHTSTNRSTGSLSSHAEHSCLATRRWVSLFFSFTDGCLTLECRNETSAAYLTALSVRETPSIIALTRQNLPQLEGSSIELAGLGGYICRNVADGKLADLIIASTGSEVSESGWLWRPQKTQMLTLYVGEHLHWSRRCSWEGERNLCSSCRK